MDGVDHTDKQSTCRQGLKGQLDQSDHCLRQSASAMELLS